MNDKELMDIRAAALQQATRIHEMWDMKPREDESGPIEERVLETAKKFLGFILG